MLEAAPSLDPLQRLQCSLAPSAAPDVDPAMFIDQGTKTVWTVWTLWRSAEVSMFVI